MRASRNAADQPVGHRAEVVGTAGMVDAASEAEASARASEVHANDPNVASDQFSSQPRHVRRTGTAGQAMHQNQGRAILGPGSRHGFEDSQSISVVERDLVVTRNANRARDAEPVPAGHGLGMTPP